MLLSVLLHLQNYKGVFFEILIFSQHIWGNVHYVSDINLISPVTLIKAFYLPGKRDTKSETWFCRRKTAEVNNA